MCWPLTLPVNHEDDALYWRQRAIAARNEAVQQSDADAKATLHEIARHYERLALLTEQRLATNK
jgi:hypothetical protein